MSPTASCPPRYLRYEELTAALQALAARRPDLVSLESLGRSHEGREIWCATVTRHDARLPREKPAVWVDGNIHATEVSASSACLYLLETLVAGDGVRPEITRVLDRCTFYVVPRVNPDGPELALADRPRYLRSSTRPHPYDEEPIEGLIREDIDGDGRLLTMRIPDPNGNWKVSSLDPRLMVRRGFDEEGEVYYRLMPEGRMLPGWDGVTLRVAPPKERLDLNRNFPGHWRTEGEQPGAGPFPTSEPEVRAVVKFITEHPNLCHAVTFHTWSGVLLRPYGTEPDDHFPAEDLWLYQKIGARGTELSGYPCLSLFHDFKYHPKELITGVFDDWVYDHLGVFSWTVELWCPQRQAGITEGFDRHTKSGDFKFMEWYHEHPEKDDLALLRWSDEKLGGRGYLDWKPFEHPDFGPIEIGGWDMMAAFRNPPLEMLEEEVRPLAEWVIWQASLAPRLELHSQKVRRLGEDHWHVQVVVQNAGYLPTYVSRKAKERQCVRPVVAELDLPPGAEVLSGRRRDEVGHLEGRYRPEAGFGGYAADTTEDRVKVEWVLKAPVDTEITVIARQDRAGWVRVPLLLTG